MKRTYNILAVLAFFMFSLGFTSCGGDKSNDDGGSEDLNLEEYYEFQGFDLSKYNIPATIMLPDETANIGASTKPEVEHLDDFFWDISVGPNFRMHIEDYGDNENLVKEHKEELKKRKMFEINYVVDEPNLIIYEKKLVVRGEKGASKRVGFEHKSYHVYGQCKVKDINYELRSRDEGYEKVIIDLMAKSIRSFREKNGSAEEGV